MKKIILLSVMLLGFCCSCARNSVLPAHPPAFLPTQSCIVHMHTPQMQMTAAWKYDGSSVFVIQEPADLSGLKIFCSAEECTASAGDVSVPFPQQAVFAAIDRSYRALLNSAAEPAQTSEGWKYENAYDGYTALQNGEDGTLLSMDFPKEQIRVTFEP